MLILLLSLMSSALALPNNANYNQILDPPLAIYEDHNPNKENNDPNPDPQHEQELVAILADHRERLDKAVRARLVMMPTIQKEAPRPVLQVPRPRANLAPEPRPRYERPASLHRLGRPPMMAPPPRRHRRRYRH